MLLGYARVSTDDQPLNLQHDALNQVGCDQIFADQVSGAATNRPGLRRLFEHARAGDTIVVWQPWWIPIRELAEQDHAVSTSIRDTKP